MSSIYAPPTQNALQKTLDAQLSQGVTASATFNNTTGLQNLPGMFVVDRVDSSATATPSKREYISYTAVSGSTVTGLTRGLGGSSDQDHAVGAVVEFVPDVVFMQAIYDALDVLLDPSDMSIDTTAIVTPTGSQTLTNKTITAPIINKTTGTSAFPQVYGVKDLGTVGATETVNWANGDRQKMTLDENLTITFSNPAEGQTITLYMLQDGSGTNTITFSDTITWADDTTPTWTTTASKMNIAVITYVGSAYYGVGNAFA